MKFTDDAIAKIVNLGKKNRWWKKSNPCLVENLLGNGWLRVCERIKWCSSVVVKYCCNSLKIVGSKEEMTNNNDRGGGS